MSAAEVVLKANNCAVREVCARCGLKDRAESPFAAFIEGTWDWVCPRCAAESWGMPAATLERFLAADVILDLEALP